MKKGFSHIDLATKDMDATRAFYEGILGFPVVRADIIEFEAGGSAQHIFFDCGDGQMIAFAHSARFPDELDTGINKGLGLPNGVYHFAFEAETPENLFEIKTALERHGVAVRGVEDHEGWCRSIYFMDPNGLQLEYCCQSRPLNVDDATPQVRFRVSREGKKLPA